MGVVEDQFYNPKQVAALLGVHQRTVQRWLRTGQLKGIRISRGWRILGSDILSHR